MPDRQRTLPVLAFASGDTWEAWLAAEGASSPGLWLKLAKKGAASKSLSKQEAIDGALCHGWIDGQIDKFDADHWLIRFTPRKPGSRWSQINRNRAMELTAQGRMREAGLKEIEKAKTDGRWDKAYAPQSKAEVPADLQAALDANEAAKRLFAELDSANRYAVLYRIHDAKKPETRASRIETFVAMLARGETIHPRKKA